jgi:hypothetical protein
MKLYSAKIRLAGNPDNEVIEHNLSAAEILILQRIHGKPGILGGGNHTPVVDIVHTANTNRTDARERARLAAKYTAGELSQENGAKIVQALFGVNGPLPQEYAEPKFEPVEDIVSIDEGDEQITPVEPIVRTKGDAVSAVA